MIEEKATIYHPDPERGCGRKEEGGYYIEAEFSGQGMMNAWTAAHGDGMEDGTNCYANIPPRRALYGNLAASLTTGEFVSVDIPFAQALAENLNLVGLQALYTHLKQKTAEEALFDHVGSKHYSPWSIAQEVARYGPSRRVPPQMAEEIARKTPLPIVFTHSDVPVFADLYEQDEAIGLIKELWGSDDTLVYEANWHRPEWGIWSADYPGDDHYMRPVLWLMHAVTREWGKVQGRDPLYADARAFFDGVHTAEQVVGISWITRVGYVPKDEDDIEAATEQLGRKGIRIIDIDAAPTGLEA